MSGEAAYPNIPTRGAIDLSVLQRPVVPAPGTPGGAPAAGGYVVDVTGETFPAIVQASAQYPVIMLLWMPTDKVNADLATTLGALSAEFGGRFLLARRTLSLPFRGSENQRLLDVRASLEAGMAVEVDL